MDTQIHTEYDIRFLGEQDGQPERELKARWLPILSQSPSVRRAFLAIVSYDRAATYQPALCISQTGGDERALVDSLSIAFRQQFNSSQALDIMFLRPEQETQLAKVCRAFYEAA